MHGFSCTFIQGTRMRDSYFAAAVVGAAYDVISGRLAMEKEEL